MKIGIIGAMEEEIQILKNKIGHREKEVIGGFEFYSGNINGVEVVLLRSGIGKVNAAMSSALLLDRYKPDIVINTGSAGGFREDLNVGDIVVSTEVRHHDVDVTIFGYEYGQVPHLPAAFKADDKLVDAAMDAAKNITSVQTVKGLIVTGDSFMNDTERVEFVRDKFDDLIAAEMEAAAIAQVCHQFNIPFVVIRALSDIAGKDSNISFDQFLDKAALHSSELVLEFVENVKRQD
ncbi:5'-methylthioadenosine/S-adenosylhomocysteine nucleosidase [Bacillus solimangrovi]|uniref:5'-methylthioadenosine/S-adenosylhomocysteine nucleosidase n=1 Tax=Bacillus solimangrovi TaxID=1305675 RepID=A0A1E5LBS0_9BACI|nr:5'-methylthioadenosine/S-adenosylhomocysteine nucleosidase [Bacillus solimangrovi]OEH91526.1 5'-methylthioadenosine/S-adenosylhomocysteine nucleosidase [Bacillus solimangrovi]